MTVHYDETFVVPASVGAYLVRPLEAAPLSPLATIKAYVRSPSLASQPPLRKAGERCGDPFEMVTEEKQRRLRRAAEAWLVANPELMELELRFDVVAFRGRRLQRLEEAFGDASPMGMLWTCLSAWCGTRRTMP